MPTTETGTRVLTSIELERQSAILTLRGLRAYWLGACRALGGTNGAGAFDGGVAVRIEALCSAIKQGSFDRANEDGADASWRLKDRLVVITRRARVVYHDTGPGVSIDPRTRVLVAWEALVDLYRESAGPPLLRLGALDAGNLLLLGTAIVSGQEGSERTIPKDVWRNRILRGAQDYVTALCLVEQGTSAEDARLDGAADHFHAVVGRVEGTTAVLPGGSRYELSEPPGPLTVAEAQPTRTLGDGGPYPESGVEGVQELIDMIVQEYDLLDADAAAWASNWDAGGFLRWLRGAPGACALPAARQAWASAGVVWLRSLLGGSFGWIAAAYLEGWLADQQERPLDSWPGLADELDAVDGASLSELRWRWAAARADAS